MEHITYESICKKLGFDPATEYPTPSDTEDDAKNVFAVLTVEELDFLTDAGYFDK
jgi:hypothetical protein